MILGGEGREGLVVQGTCVVVWYYSHVYTHIALSTHHFSTHTHHFSNTHTMFLHHSHHPRHDHHVPSPPPPPCVPSLQAPLLTAVFEYGQQSVGHASQC